MKATKQFEMVKLSLQDYGVVPGSDRVFACPLPKGFSVVLASDQLDEELKIGSTNDKYSWRKFASILCTIADGSITPDSYTFVKVEGLQIAKCWIDALA